MLIFPTHLALQDTTADPQGRRRAHLHDRCVPAHRRHSRRESARLSPLVARLPPIQSPRLRHNPQARSSMLGPSARAPENPRSKLYVDSLAFRRFPPTCLDLATCRARIELVHYPFGHEPIQRVCALVVQRDVGHRKSPSTKHDQLWSAEALPSLAQKSSVKRAFAASA
jgi:hypothetical protein